MSEFSAGPVLPVGLTPAEPARSEISEADRGAFDEPIAELGEGAAAWAATSLAKRAELLAAVHASIATQARRWALTARDIKGLDADSPLVGEEWSTGPYATLLAVGSLAATVAGLAAGRSPLADTRFGTAPDDRLTVPVLPHTPHEALLMHGFRAEVWLQPGVTADQARRSAGLGELTPTASGGVGLVLGAGNITAIPPLDVLYEIVAHNRAVLLKLNPVLQNMMSTYQSALRPLVDADLLRIVQGGAAVGEYLAHHEGIAHVHLTGNAATHDVIVYGPGPEGRKRQAAGTPLLRKEITSELGGVSPVIIVPGAWSRRDLQYQAEHVATQRLHNGGYNCIAAQAVVLSADWPQKTAFLTELRAAMARAPERPAWYPGSDNRMDAAASAYPAAERIAGGTRLLIDIPVDQDASVLETTEFFAPVLGVIELPGTGQAFLDTAVDTVNRDFVGTLGANVLIDPSQIKNLGAGFRDAIAKLRYGTIAINCWTGIGFITPTATWGAFPGNTLDDVGSGIGIVHNALLIESAERTVVTGPFRPFPRSIAHGEFALFPKPPWFVTARSAQKTGRLLAGFAAKPSWLKLAAVFGSAFKA
jgi:acyl-CoA reductase-like NAD-dependent aldehyde dehydrogenase